MRMIKEFTMYSRRDFGKLTLAGLPLGAFALRASAAIDSEIDGVEIGAQSYSFRDLSLDDAIKAMTDIGLGYCELFAPHIEHMGSPAIPANGGGGAGRRDPAERKAAAREPAARVRDPAQALTTAATCSVLAGRATASSG